MCYLLLKSMRFSCSSILKLLMSSLVPLNMKRALKLRFLSAGLPYVSYLLKLDLYIRALLLVQESPFHSSQDAWELMLLMDNDMEVATSIPL